MSWGRDWPLWLWCVADALAVYRVTRLLVADTITRPFRRWLADRYEGPLVELWFCAWCMSVWVATGVVALTWYFPFAWSLVAFGLSLSAAAGYLVVHAGAHAARVRRAAPSRLRVFTRAGRREA